MATVKELAREWGRIKRHNKLLEMQLRDNYTTMEAIEQQISAVNLKQSVIYRMPDDQLNAVSIHITDDGCVMLGLLPIDPCLTQNRN